MWTKYQVSYWYIFSLCHESASRYFFKHCISVTIVDTMWMYHTCEHGSAHLHESNIWKSVYYVSPMLYDFCAVIEWLHKAGTGINNSRERQEWITDWFREFASHFWRRNGSCWASTWHFCRKSAHDLTISVFFHHVMAANIGDRNTTTTE